MGSVVGGIMGGGKGGGSTSTATANFNPLIKPHVQDITTRAQTLSNQAYTPYTGQRVANFSGDQLQAQDMTRGLMGQYGGVFGDALNQFGQLSQQAMGNTQIDPNRIQELMNPYTQAVIDRSKNEVIDDYQRTMSGIGDQAVNMGAFGGSRQGVVEGMATQGFYDTLGDIQTQGLSNAYQQGLGATMQEMGLQNQSLGLAGSMLGQQLGAAGAGQQYGLQDIQALNQMGGQQQALQQLGLDVNYEDFLAEQEDPYTKLAFYNSIISPYAGMSMGQTQEQQQSKSGSGGLFGKILGAGMSAAGSKLGSMAMSYLPMLLSDERVKDNIKEVGELDNGLAVYAYNYKGSPKTQIGVMAQDVEKKNPEAVGETPEGIKMVDYSKAVEDNSYAQGGRVKRGDTLRSLIEGAPPTQVQMAQAQLPQQQESEDEGGLGSLLGSFMGGGEGGGFLGTLIGKGLSKGADLFGSEGMAYAANDMGAGIDAYDALEAMDLRGGSGGFGDFLGGLKFWNEGGLIDYGNFRDGGLLDFLSRSGQGVEQGLSDYVEGSQNLKRDALKGLSDVVYGIENTPYQLDTLQLQERTPGESNREYLQRNLGNLKDVIPAALGDTALGTAKMGTGLMTGTGEFVSDFLSDTPKFRTSDVAEEGVQYQMTPQQLTERAMRAPGGLENLQKTQKLINDRLLEQQESESQRKQPEVTTAEQGRQQQALRQMTQSQQPRQPERVAVNRAREVLQLPPMQQAAAQASAKEKADGFITNQALFNAGLAMMMSDGDIFEQLGAGGKAYAAVKQGEQEQKAAQQEALVKQQQQQFENQIALQKLANDTQRADAAMAAAQARRSTTSGEGLSGELKNRLKLADDTYKNAYEFALNNGEDDPVSYANRERQKFLDLQTVNLEGFQ